MEPPVHSLVSLFKQLGMDNTTQAIENFIQESRPLPGHLELHEAEFWSESQAAFLREAIEKDSDWSEVVDELNALLHHSDG